MDLFQSGAKWQFEESFSFVIFQQVNGMVSSKSYRIASKILLISINAYFFYDTS